MTIRDAIDRLKAFGNLVMANTVIAWLTGDPDSLPPRFEDALELIARTVDEDGCVGTAAEVRGLRGRVRFGPCEHEVVEAVSC
jgi:hypothetical protein